MMSPAESAHVDGVSGHGRSGNRNAAIEPILQHFWNDVDKVASSR
jgi:hypothetical protein